MRWATPKNRTRGQRRLRWADQDDQRGEWRGTRPITPLDVATGPAALAGTLLARAVQAGDREWLQSEPARFWAHIAGLRKKEFERTLRAWLG